MMWAWAIGVFSLAAAVNQLAIGLCRRAPAAIESDLDDQPSSEP
jgi:hypothetical protein